MVPKWTHWDEIAFIQRVARRDRAKAVRYCELVLSDKRAWDNTVDLYELKQWINEFLRKDATEVK
jgi:hypothetical protein